MHHVGRHARRREHLRQNVKEDDPEHGASAETEQQVKPVPEPDGREAAQAGRDESHTGEQDGHQVLSLLLLAPVFPKEVSCGRFLHP